jgi:hypothetical protein
VNDGFYSVTYRSPEDGQITTIKARSVGDSDLGPGFVCLSDFVFDTSSRLLNPTEEAVRKRFENVRRLHLNVFAIQSIAEMGTDHPGLQLDPTDRPNVVVLPPRSTE